MDKMLTNDQYDISVWSLHISQWSLSNPRVFLHFALFKREFIIMYYHELLRLSARRQLSMAATVLLGDDPRLLVTWWKIN